MLCAGNATPVRPGAASVEFCYDHFELAETGGVGRQRPAWALHALGLSDEMTAAFALVPAGRPEAAQWFTARWGRAGVGPASFMPVPVQLETDERPSVEVYGFRSSNFNWRNCQWEIVERVTPHAFELPTADGECLDVPGNATGVWAFAEGSPVVCVDDLGFGEHAEFALHKQTDEANRGASYQVRFGGRIWRRWLTDRVGHPSPLELLAFDTSSPVLQQALDEVWGEIGGQEEAKRELIRAIQWPVLYPELFLLFKRKRSRGVLLYGPPGCGKTLLGGAVVKLLAALYHRKADQGGFKYVKGHQLLDQYVGNSEKAVKALFDDARRWREQRGYPAVLFFDEADALFKR
ncbi:MAG: AAA family ATPase, partial [Acidobacteria bacterium]|nr:AAA family ATPase [Acidobacteriota bacterium]